MIKKTQESQKERKAYVRPSLVRYGDVKDIIRTGGSSTSSDGNGTRAKTTTIG